MSTPANQATRLNARTPENLAKWMLTNPGGKLFNFNDYYKRRYYGSYPQPGVAQTPPMPAPQQPQPQGQAVHEYDPTPRFPRQRLTVGGAGRFMTGATNTSPFTAGTMDLDVDLEKAWWEEALRRAREGGKPTTHDPKQPQEVDAVWPTADTSWTIPTLPFPYMQWMLKGIGTGSAVHDWFNTVGESGIPGLFYSPRFQDVFGTNAEMPEFSKEALSLLLGEGGVAGPNPFYGKATNLYEQLAGLSASGIDPSLLQRQPRGIAGPGYMEQSLANYVMSGFRYDPITGEMVLSTPTPSGEIEGLGAYRGAVETAGLMPDLSTIGDPNKNALLKNYLDIFEKTQKKQMLDEAALMGLGRSTGAMSAIADARQRAMMPAIETAIQLENERIGRLMGAQQQLGSAYLQQAANQMAREQEAARRLADLGYRETGRAQAEKDAAYEELQNLRNLQAGLLGTRLSGLQAAAAGLQGLGQADISRQLAAAQSIWDIAQRARSINMEPGMFNFSNWQNVMGRLWDMAFYPVYNVPYGSVTAKGQVVPYWWQLPLRT